MHPFCRIAAFAAALCVVSAGTAHAACPAPSGPPLVVRPVADTRLMTAHPNANDGAAGLVWLKRSSHVRGLVGFDLSCQAAATPDLECAEIEVSVYDGSPRLGGTFLSAHRMLVPWIEGTQSFNEFKHAGEKLGSFPGTGLGSTWDCRVDPDVSNNTSDGCPPAEKWKGADDCSGVPCYEPIPSTGIYADDDQTSVAWDVTATTVGATGEASWLLKIQDETVKSGSMKFFTREGARFMAENEPLPGGASRFDAAPRLLLRGPGLNAPSATLVAPGLHTNESPAPIRITQTSATIGTEARWENRSTGEWGWMAADGDADWMASVPLVNGTNEIEFTLHDACGTEGKVTETITFGSNDPCLDPSGASPDECPAAFLCYGAKTTSHTDKFESLQGLELRDSLQTSLVNVRKVHRICVPADIDGAGIANPFLYGVGYRAKSVSGEAPPVPAGGYALTDQFGASIVTPLRVDGLIAPGSLGYGVPPPPPNGPTDPYRCYRSVAARETVAGRVAVHVVDAFEDREYRLRQLRRMCLPTSDTGTFGPPLLCYSITRARGEDKHGRIRRSLHINDHFGTLAIDSRREYELCVVAQPE